MNPSSRCVVALVGAMLAIPLGLAAQGADPQTPQEDAGPKKPVAAAKGSLPLAGKLRLNVKVRLVAARISKRRGQNLTGKFVTLGKNAREFVVSFPAHSHPTHEATLMTIVRSCSGWPSWPDPYGWHKATATATFSIPKGTKGSVTDFREWFLVSLEFPKGK